MKEQIEQLRRESDARNALPGETSAIRSPSAKGAFTIAGFCDWASISRSKVYDEISAGRIRIRKVGARTLILRADAEEWLNSLPEAA
jgi:excisionase family DNA binding protein